MKETLLFVHIAGDSVAPICALMATSSKKGSNFHRKVGRIYALGMATIVVTAIPMAIISEKMFLFLIALFSGCLVFAGWRFAVFIMPLTVLTVALVTNVSTEPA